MIKPRWMMSLAMALFFLVGLSGAVSANASPALPQGSQAIEAESFDADGKTWLQRDHFPNWYGGMPSGGKFMAGHPAGLGEATAKVTLAQSGAHNLWVRYVDLNAHRDGIAFKVAVLRDGQVIAEKEFDTQSLRATAEGQKKWGTGFGQFVWDKLSFEADAGEVTLRLSKSLAKAVTASGARQIDVFVVTPDLNYEPTINALHPIYVKVHILPEQPHPVAVHIFGRRSMAPWFTPHLNINRDGVFEGPDNGAGNMKQAFLQPGESSPWVRISDYLSYHGNNGLSFWALQSYFKRETSAAFEVLFSRTPDDSGIFLRQARKGDGDGMVLLVNLVNGNIVTEGQGSEQSLALAKAVPQVQGQRPVAYPFVTGMALTRDRSASQVIENELEALKLIGINGMTNAAGNEADAGFSHYFYGAFYFHLTDGDLSRPNLQKIDAFMKQTAAKVKPLNVFALNMMDEPGIPLDYPAKHKAVADGFEAYLKEQGVTLQGGMSFDPKDGQQYYWSVRYRNNVMTRMLQTGTTIAQQHMPGMPTTVNFATELVYNGNMVERGVDWYEIFNTGALTYGWHEDWANTTGSYQVVGYQSDVMRSAARRRGLTYGIYNILGRDEWDVQAKGFMSIGHGNRAMHFFNYGPYYTLSSDTQSHRPDTYVAIKNITFPTGLVDKHLMEGKPARGDAAQLLSVTSDIWHVGTDNVYGKERMFLNLLLRHANISLDVLSEDDLSDELDAYRVLFVTDSHLRRSQVEPLVAWVKKGGVLYLGAGALIYDENNAPLNIDAALGLQREPVQITGKAGRADYELIAQKPVREVAAGVQALVGVQEPLNKTVQVGQGRVVFSGFFPGLSYMGTSSRVKDAGVYSVRDYAEAYRRYITQLNLGITPRLTTNNHLVEANLIESKAADVIVLSNWTGRSQTVTVTLANAAKYGKVTGAGVEIASQSNNGGRLVVTAKVAAGGYILCEK